MSQQNESLPIVRFGKYKDKPVTDLLSDENYCNWLKDQPWFPKKNPSIYNIIVNKIITTDNTPTPIHNQLQNRFLNDENRIKLLIKIHDLEDEISKIKEKDIKDFVINYFNNFLSSKVQFEGSYNWDIVIRDVKSYFCSFTPLKSSQEINEILENIDEIISEYNRLDDNKSSGVYRNILLKYNKSISKIKCKLTEKVKNIFDDSINKRFFTEYTNYQEFLDCKNPEKLKLDNDSHCINLYCKHYSYYYIEVKPTLGDDYPCVLRKMSNQARLTIADTVKYDKTAIFILVVGEFNSDVTSTEQLKEIFANSNIRVIFTDELNLI